MIIAAWGVIGKLNSRNIHVENLIITNGFDLHCLGVSTRGYPRHPLYLRSDAKPLLYKARVKEITELIPTVKRRIVSREGIDLKTMSDNQFHKDVMED